VKSATLIVSLCGLHEDMGPPQFVLNTFGRTRADFPHGDFSNIATFGALRFKSALSRINFIANILPTSFQSRLKLGFVGNRLFAIVKIVAHRIELQDDDQVLRTIFDQQVYDNQPYVTFHPDHVLNPMHNHARMCVWEYRTNHLEIWIDYGDLD
jgi:hypothetical protein